MDSYQDLQDAQAASMEEDGFDAWAAGQGAPATEWIDGAEAIR